MDRSPLFHEWPIEKVTVVRCDDSGTSRLNVIKEMHQHGPFVTSIDDGEGSLEFRFGSIIEIVNVSRHDFTVGNEKALDVSSGGCAGGEFTWPSIMYEIIIIESTTASGNLRGDLLVSISKARTTGSARFNLSAMTSIVTCPAFALTVYHFPMRMSCINWGEHLVIYLYLWPHGCGMGRPIREHR